MERCRFPETAVAIAYETQGLFELAQESYEKVIGTPLLCDSCRIAGKFRGFKLSLIGDLYHFVCLWRNYKISHHTVIR